jgi:membrane protein implicated in regulation of membrane protease activity
MNGFFSDLNAFQAVFFVISASSTIILVIQTILALIGISNDSETEVGESYVSDVDTEADAADSDFDAGEAEAETDGIYDPNGLRLFTIRGIMAFLMMGGWVGFLFSRAGVNDIVSLLCALASGTIALVLMAKMMQILMGMQADGTIKIKNALGQTGQVYIRIPGEEKGKGKVNVTVQGKMCEFEAVTEQSEMLKTGETVYVTDIKAENVLVVEKVNEILN